MGYDELQMKLTEWFSMTSVNVHISAFYFEYIRRMKIAETYRMLQKKNDCDNLKTHQNNFISKTHIVI